MSFIDLSKNGKATIISNKTIEGQEDVGMFYHMAI
jgi:hypothetical protein